MGNGTYLTESSSSPILIYLINQNMNNQNLIISLISAEI